MSLFETFKKYWVLTVFSIAYIIGFGIYYVSTGNTEFLGYLAVLLIIGGVIALTANVSKLTSFSLWLLSIWGLLHMAGGSLRVGDGVLYGWRIIELINRGGDFYILKMDQLIHVYGFFVSAVVVHELVAPRVAKMHWGLLVFIAVIGSLGLSAFNEIIEFIVFISVENNGVGDIYNMGLDLIFNFIGALMGAFFCAATAKKPAATKVAAK